MWRYSEVPDIQQISCAIAEIIEAFLLLVWCFAKKGLDQYLLDLYCTDHAVPMALVWITLWLGC
jgi:hypothetical protein